MRPGDVEATPVGALAPNAPSVIATDEPICIVTWNVHKGLDPRLTGELELVSERRTPDIVALQEARPSLHVPGGFAGHHAASFRLGLLGPAEGVMTLTRVAPIAAHRIRSGERELFVLTPKAALISFLPLSDGRSLCVINVHGLNFDPSGKQLARQLEDLRQLVEYLDGPLVITGDFNTWNEPRLEAVEELRDGLGLIEVCAEIPGGKKGHMPIEPIRKAVGLDPRLHLDRLYVRGLEPMRASWLEEFRASDHVALCATLSFRGIKTSG